MRWLLIPLALGVAMTALYALLTGPVQLDSAMHPDEVSARGRDPVDSVQGSSRGHGEIREPSRQKLREILQEVDGRTGDER
jgi:hypothetical protein